MAQDFGLMASELTAMVQKIAADIKDSGEKGAEAQMYLDAARLFQQWPKRPADIMDMLKRVIAGSRTEPITLAKKILAEMQKANGVVANAKKRVSGKAKPDAGSYN